MILSNFLIEKLPENLIGFSLGLKFNHIWVSPIIKFYPISMFPTTKFYSDSVSPTTKFYSVWVSPTTALVAQAWLGGLIHWAVVGDSEM